MTTDILTELLSEPRPQLVHHPIETFSSTPVGFEITAFGVACNLVSAADHAEALDHWEKRQTRLLRFRSAGFDSNCEWDRRILEGVQRTCRFERDLERQQTERVSAWLTASRRRVQDIVSGSQQRQLATPTVRATARSEVMTAACEDIAAETTRVLLRHKETWNISVAELYEMTARRN